MLIRFLKSDPRAGMIVDMDSSLGQKHVDEKRAELVVAQKAVASAPENKAITTLPNKRKGK